MSLPTAQIPDFVADAFNLPIVLPIAQAIPKRLPAANVDGVRKYNQEPLRTSRLGTYIYETLELYSLDQELLFSFPDQVVIEMVENPKRIIRTEMQGRNSTVKEYIGMGDWGLQIMGVFNNPSSKDYPEDLVADLVRVYERNEALRIDGSSLCTFGINQIVLYDLKLPRRAGFPSQQQFTLYAWSDEPIELEILNS